MQLVREEGAFTGVLLLNMTVTFSLMFVVLIAYVFWRGISGEDVPLLPFAVGALTLAVGVPPVFYPFAAGGWAGIDQAMRPLDEWEVLDADFHANDQ